MAVELPKISGVNPQLYLCTAQFYFQFLHHDFKNFIKAGTITSARAQFG
jgi:hypothetical protein